MITGAALSIDTPTSIRARMKDRTANGDVYAAEVSFTADRNGGYVALIIARLIKESNGTQTLRLSERTSLFTERLIAECTGLGSDFVDVRVIADPPNDSVTLFVEGIDRGTFAYQRLSTFGIPQWGVTLYSAGSDGEFDRIEIVVPEVAP